MVVAALLNEFLHEGEKTHDDIVAYLEKAREHPTCKLYHTNDACTPVNEVRA